MGLELPGIARIDTPAEARGAARRWRRMANELAPPHVEAKNDQVRGKARELRQRAEAAERWAREEEDAQLRAAQAADSAAGPENVVPIRPGASKPRAGRRERSRAASRAYGSARPPAMRLAHRGKQHIFQGAGAVAPAGDVYDLFFEGIGMTLAIVTLALLLRSPGALGEFSQHFLGFVHRAVDTVDPISGQRLAPPARPSGSSGARTKPAAVAHLA